MQSASSTPNPGGAAATPSSTTATTTTTTPQQLPHPTASGTGADASSSSEFEFPREYHFPPFFTRQPNATTRHSQLEKWSALVLGWARHRRQFRVSVVSEGGGDAAALWGNARLKRRLAPADAREVLEFMRREGRAEPVAKGGGGGGGLGLIDDLGIVGSGGGGGSGGDKDNAGDVYWVYWKTPEEWAQDLEAWVEETAQKGVVFTLYELTEGEDTRGTEFHGLDPELLQKALQVLVKRGKAQIFGQEDQQGVKFF